MTRLIPPVLTALAIWALCLAEGHAETRAVGDPVATDCPMAAEDAAPVGDARPAPGCPALTSRSRP